MRIIFMGSGIFGHKILQSIVPEHNIVAIYTASKNTNSRNAKSNPVKKLALDIGSNVVEIDRFSTSDIEKLRSYDPDIIIVASYGLILPNDVLQIGNFPAINVHPSLLPRWRGAAPIERCIESGDSETGVCIIEMTAKLDAGVILNQTKITLSSEITSMKLYDICSNIGGQIILDTIKQLTNGTVKKREQNIDGITYAKKIQNDELIINDSENVETIERKIRAFDAAGGCYFVFKGERIKILKAKLEECNVTNSDFGKVDIQNGRLIYSGGYIIPILMQRAGKKILPASDVWRGLR